jgi:hypothetical protein
VWLDPFDGVVHSGEISMLKLEKKNVNKIWNQGPTQASKQPMKEYFHDLIKPVCYRESVCMQPGSCGASFSGVTTNDYYYYSSRESSSIGIQGLLSANPQPGRSLLVT